MRRAGSLSNGCLIVSLLLGSVTLTSAKVVRRTDAATDSLGASIRRLRIMAKAAWSSSYGDSLFEPEREGRAKLTELQRQIHGFGDAATPALLSLLTDSDWRVNEAAADILQTNPSPRVQKALIRYCLGRILDIPRMTKQLEGPGYDRLRKFGVAALPAIEQAFHSSAHRDNADYLASLVRVLAAMPNQAGLPLITEAVHHPCAPVAAAAASELPSVAGQAALPLLVELLERKPTGCMVIPGPILECICAVGALRKLGNPDAVEPLLRLLIRLGPITEAQEKRNLFSEYPDCRNVIRAAIDVLTGQQPDGDPTAIGDWLEGYKRNHSATQPTQKLKSQIPQDIASRPALARHLVPAW